MTNTELMAFCAGTTLPAGVQPMGLISRFLPVAGRLGWGAQATFGRCPSKCLCKLPAVVNFSLLAWVRASWWVANRSDSAAQSGALGVGA